MCMNGSMGECMYVHAYVHACMCVCVCVCACVCAKVPKTLLLPQLGVQSTEMGVHTKATNVTPKRQNDRHTCTHTHTTTTVSLLRMHAEG